MWAGAALEHESPALVYVHEIDRVCAVTVSDIGKSRTEAVVPPVDTVRVSVYGSVFSGRPLAEKRTGTMSVCAAILLSAVPPVTVQPLFSSHSSHCQEGIVLVCVHGVVSHFVPSME
jgi:hypothetical protein